MIFGNDEDLVDLEDLVSYFDEVLERRDLIQSMEEDEIDFND